VWTLAGRADTAGNARSCWVDFLLIDLLVGVAASLTQTWPACGVFAQVSRDSSRIGGGSQNLGSTKRAAQTISLAPEGTPVQTYPPCPNHHRRGVRRNAPNHQADGQLSPRDAALHMTDVALIGWPPDRNPSSTGRMRRGRHRSWICPVGALRAGVPCRPARTRACRERRRRECPRILIRLTSAAASPGPRRRLPSRPGPRTRLCNG
jgi:hypothetical protein